MPRDEAPEEIAMNRLCQLERVLWSEDDIDAVCDLDHFGALTGPTKRVDLAELCRAVNALPCVLVRRADGAPSAEWAAARVKLDNLARAMIAKASGADDAEWGQMFGAVVTELWKLLDQTAAGRELDTLVPAIPL